MIAGAVFLTLSTLSGSAIAGPLWLRHGKHHHHNASSTAVQFIDASPVAAAEQVNVVTVVETEYVYATPAVSSVAMPATYAAATPDSAPTLLRPPDPFDERINAFAKRAERVMDRLHRIEAPQAPRVIR